MKRLTAVLFSTVLLGIMLTGCAESYYKVPDGHCIVGIDKKFKLYSESEGKYCEPIEKAIRGVKKSDKDNYYYSVVEGAEYTLCVDDYAEECGGFGAGINSSVACAWWQGNVLAGFVKEYSENSQLQDDVFFQTNYKQLNSNVAVSFTENCTVKAIYEPYINVGGIFEVRKTGDDYFDSRIGDYLNTDGTLNDLTGFYYLLLIDEVCVHQDAWRTNFEITGYNCSSNEEGYINAIRAEFTTKSPEVADGEEWVLYQICRTYRGKYFINSPFYAGNPEGFGMPVREHELKLTFEN